MFSHFVPFQKMAFLSVAFWHINNNNNSFLVWTRGPYHRRSHRHKNTKMVSYTSARITESVFAHDQP